MSDVIAGKSWWQNGLLLAVSLVISLLVGEFITAIFFPQNLGTWGMTRDGLTTHVPNLSVFLTRYGHQIHINSHGMRDREHEVAKPAGTIRILVLGDSFMEANQVPFEDSLPSLLEANLSARLGHPVEVINASVSGWGTDDQVTYLARYGARFQPDLILVAMTLHNDVHDNLAEEFHAFGNGVLQEKLQSDIPLREYAVLQIKEFLASHSHLYQVLLRAIRSSSTQGEGNRLESHVAGLLMRNVDSDIERGWNMTHQLIRKMKQTRLRGEAKMAVVLIPLWIQVSERRLEEFLADHQLSRNQILIDQPQRKMRQIGEAEGVEVFDLLPDFQKSEKADPDKLYLHGDGHWTAAGHHLGASLTAEHLALESSLQLVK
jgi:hypothetical protein